MENLPNPINDQNTLKKLELRNCMVRCAQPKQFTPKKRRFRIPNLQLIINPNFFPLKTLKMTTTPTRSKQRSDHHHHHEISFGLQWRPHLLSLMAFFLFLVLLALFYLHAHSQLPSLFNPKPTSGLSSARFNKGFGDRARRKAVLDRSRIAVCLVGGARRFELTGPSIVKNLLREYPSADLFLNSWLDENSYKFLVLATAPRIAAVRISEAKRVQETAAQARVLTSSNSPNGIQGLLQYFSLVEGCADLIRAHEHQTNTTYDWILRTRVDGYWSAPLAPSAFDLSSYVVPRGSRYGGLNDRFGLGIPSTSTPALSRLSLIPNLDSSGYRGLNSESSFKAQLDVTNTNYREVSMPFCIVSDRKYGFPPARNGVPVAAMGSGGLLSGAKCRPCRAVCKGSCAEEVVGGLGRTWGWTEWKGVELCDASGEWEEGWERVFDEAAWEEAAEVRRMVGEMRVEECVKGWEGLKGMVSSNGGSWEAPDGEVVCRLGLKS